MALLNRETLKKFFRKGSSPSEEHFSELIDSVVNKIDDGFAKSIEDGLQLTPLGDSEKVMTLYYQTVDDRPAWQISLPNEKEESGLKIEALNGRVALFMDDQARVGVQTTKPAHTLDVNGTLGTKARVGTFFKGKVPGDGKWHNVLVKLKEPQIFEVVARIDGDPGSGMYAMLHATAVSTYGRSRNRIHQTETHYGWFLNKLQMRWHGDTKDYALQIRTRINYGEQANGKPYFIRFHISRLWDDQQEFEEYDEELCQLATNHNPEEETIKKLQQ